MIYGARPYIGRSVSMNIFKKMFGKKKTSQMPKEVEAYIGQIDKDVFPDGFEQKSKELSEVADILGVKPLQISETFFYACTRAFIGNCDRETLIRGISHYDNGLSEVQINRLAKYVFTKLFRQTSGITDPTYTEAFLNAQGFLKDNYGGIIYDEIPGGYGDFGISINNPVPVNGILANEKYLCRILTAEGLSIKWCRLGSGGADNIDNPIDIYNITDERGNKRPTIYISPYHPSTSKKAPKGYKMK